MNINIESIKILKQEGCNIENQKREKKKKAGYRGLSSLSSFDFVNLPDENRTTVMKIVNPDKWAVVDYKLRKYKDQSVTIKFTAEVKRVGVAGHLCWQINNDGYPMVDYITDAEPDIWHSMSGDWTGSFTHSYPQFYLSTWENNSDRTTYYIDNFSIEIIHEDSSDYWKGIIIPQIPDDFFVSDITEPFRHGLSDEDIHDGITAFREFLYQLHDKKSAEYKSYDVKKAELFDKFLPALLFLIGFHGRLETEPRKELIVYGSDLLILPNQNSVGINKLSAKKTCELFDFLSDMGFYFEDLFYEDKVDLSKTGQFYVTYENDDNFISGLKLIAEATINIKSDYLLIFNAFMRCDFYSLVNKIPQEHIVKISDFIHMLPPEKREWVIDLDKYLISNGCKIDGKIKEYIVFTYASQKKKKGICVLSFKPTGFTIQLICQNVKNLDEVTPVLPESMLTVLKRKTCSFCGCNAPYKISHGSEDFLCCRYTKGFAFSLDSYEEREVLRKWVELEFTQ